MTTEPLLIGLDVGTTNMKAIAFTPSGRAVAQASVPTPTHSPRAGWAVYQPEELWTTIIGLLRQITATVDARDIVGIAVAGMGEAGVLLDARNQPVYPIIAWFDSRTQPQAEQLEALIGRDALFRVTGLSLQPIFGLCKLLWLKQNEAEVFERAARWLNVADYIAFRLSGEQATDYSLASRTLALDITQRAWAKEVLQTLDMPVGLFAPLCQSGTRVGYVSADAARETGLPQTTVVATGGHDHVCGAFGIGVTQPGMMLNSMGTAETVFLTLDQPLTDPLVGRQGFTQGLHVIPDHSYVFGALYTSGACMDWFRQRFTEMSSFDTLIEEAAHVNPGSGGVCFLPQLQLASAPYDDPKGRGAFIGLGLEIQRGALFRAVLEGIAYESRQMIEAMLAHTPLTSVRSILAFGGGSRNTVLMNIKATVLKSAIEVPAVHEATCLGAAMLAGVSSGIYRDAHEASSSIEMTTHTYRPLAETVQIYDDLYKQVYKQLYMALKPLHHALYPFVKAGD